MVALQSRFHEENIVFSINTEIYPLDVIMKTAYNYTDGFYIFFDYEKDGFIEVKLKHKEDCDVPKLEAVVGEFYNELLNQKIRLDIQKSTSNIRQLILGRALYTECIETNGVETSQSTQPVMDYSEININDDYNINPYQISSPWTTKMGFGGDV
jgi:radical SAM pair-associated protein